MTYHNMLVNTDSKLNLYNVIKKSFDNDLYDITIPNSSIFKFKKSVDITEKYNTKHGCNNYIINTDHTYDAIYGIEIVSNKDENLLDNFVSIDLIIGGSVINTYYLSNFDVTQTSEQTIIKLDFNKVFMNFFFIPKVAIIHHEIQFKLNCSELVKFTPKVYLSVAVFDEDIKKQLTKTHYEMLINYYIRYFIKPKGKQINIRVENSGKLLSDEFINSLRFKFEHPIKFNSIKLYVNNNDTKELLNEFTINDLKLISNKEFILDNFYFKTFMFNNITLEFDTDLTDNKLTLITSNYNILRIMSGMAGLGYIGLERNIS